MQPSHWKNPKIGFVLASRTDIPLPSTRIAVMNMVPYLKEAGYETEILFMPDESSNSKPDMSAEANRILDRNCDIVVFQKTQGPSIQKLVSCLNSSGVKTVFLVCDLIDAKMAQLTHATVIVTEYLKSLYPSDLQRKIHVVHDGIERVGEMKTDYRAHRGSRKDPIRAILVTSSCPHHLPMIGCPPQWLKVHVCGAHSRNKLQRARQTYWQMQTLKTRDRWAFARLLASRRIARTTWDPLGVYSDIRQADIGVLPIASDTSLSEPSARLWELKSENRLTLKMSMGLPVIATPIPSYLPIIKDGVNGFLANTRKQWLSALDELRDPETRQTVGQRAREAVVERYSMPNRPDSSSRSSTTYNITEIVSPNFADRRQLYFPVCSSALKSFALIEPAMSSPYRECNPLLYWKEVFNADLGHYQKCKCGEFADIVGNARKLQFILKERVVRGLINDFAAYCSRSWLVFLGAAGFARGSSSELYIPGYQRFRLEYQLPLRGKWCSRKSAESDFFAVVLQC